MSPEQARGETHIVGPPADQYALGAILYELLTGRPPFQGTSVLDTLDQVRKKEPVPPSQLQHKVPRDIETICLKCLEKESSRRYPDVIALVEDLRRFRDGKPIVARPVSDAERAWRWCLRNKGVATLGAAVAALLVLVTVVSAAAAATVSRKNQALGEANTALGAANTALEAANGRAEERRRDAEEKKQLAEAAARAPTNKTAAPSRRSSS
jgi:hypothetical protein